MAAVAAALTLTALELDWTEAVEAVLAAEELLATAVLLVLEAAVLVEATGAALTPPLNNASPNAAAIIKLITDLL